VGSEPRLVALKIFFQPGDKVILEAQKLASLSHPHIVRLYRAGRSNDGLIFLVMEYMPGKTLADLFKAKGPLDEEKAVEIAVQVLQALDYLHGQGYVHMDIKPHNILFDAEGKARVGDFGLAEIIGDKTYINHGGGTLPYMAPEAIRKKTRKASDLWSLGIVLHEMLTGERPFRGETVEQIMYKILHEPPKISPSLKEPIKEVIQKALSKKIDQRYVRPEDFIQALHDLRIPSLMQVQLIAIHATVRREKDKFHYQLSVEAENQGNIKANWGGITVNVPSVDSRELYQITAVHLKHENCQSSYSLGPDEEIWGFLDNGSFGRLPARCLFMEGSIDGWESRKRIKLKSLLALPVNPVEFNIRTWATWVQIDGTEKTKGDPDWGSATTYDQQKIPAYKLIVGFH